MMVIKSWLEINRLGENKMSDEDWKRQESSELKDLLGREIKVGHKVIRSMRGWEGHLEVLEVTEVRDGKLYLDNSKNPIHYPGRLVIKPID